MNSRRPTLSSAGAAVLARATATLSEAGANLAAWGRDYVYAARRQAAGMLKRGEPSVYRRPDSEKPAAVLLPGIYETWTFMRPLARVLHQHGYDVHAVTDLGYNGGTIGEMASLVDEHIRREGLRECVLVGHSKGGLIGKRLLAQRRQDGLIRGLVTLNTPFGGSPLARLLPVPALRLFLPHSPELAELGASRDVNRHIVSIYGRFDPHIPGGCHLDGAHNVQLDTRGHFRPLGDARVHAAILEGIRRLSR